MLYLLLPLVLLRLLWRSKSNIAYRQRIPERLGFVSQDSQRPVIWLHAVSVGETIAARPLIESILKDYPDYRLLVTTTTPTGSAQLKNLFSTRVAHVYFPYDLPDVIARFMRKMNPLMLIVMETEIWPNLYAACNKREVPLLMLNARLSEKSVVGYSKFKSLVSETLANVDVISVRSIMDAERFKRLGASEQQIKVLGNIKYDIKPNKQQIAISQQRQKEWGVERKVWVAASTHEGEDKDILMIYAQLLIQFPSLILILVPRHPERFDDVYEMCQALEKQDICTIRHSQVDTYANQNFNIILGDTMGIMQSWFASADVVFVGGSLVPTGGHNPLEAILFGVPVVSGKYMFNFEDMLSTLGDSGLLTLCENTTELKQNITKLLTESNKELLLKKSEEIMQQHRGVTARLIKLIGEY